MIKKNEIEKELARVKKVFVKADDKINKILLEHKSNVLLNGVYLDELIKRPELDYFCLKEIDLDRNNFLGEEICEQVNIKIKYEGYIKRQMNQIEKFKKLEEKKLPKEIDYRLIKGLSREAIDHLERIKPENIGQALRIAGVSHADISVLLIYLKAYKNK